MVSAARRALGIAVIGIAVIGALARGAAADSAKLAAARRAVASVSYDDAQRLLVEALQDGDNSPAALGEIYQLSARTAIVLDHPELAEQYYRRWLAIAPGAALPEDASPKLRAPFVAAEAFIAAHGRLDVRIARVAEDVVVSVVADPLAMAHAVIAVDADRRSPPVAIGADRTARIRTSGGWIAVLDADRNRLVELPVPAEPSASAPPQPARSASRPAPGPGPGPAPVERGWLHRWQPWAVASVVLGGTAIGFAVAALSAQHAADRAAEDSVRHRLSDVEASVGRARLYGGISAATGAAAITGAATAAVLYFAHRNDGATHLAPVVGARGAALAVIGRF